MNDLTIFDTTLRDGEQSPGASMDVQEKLVLAQQLERLKVDVVEAGFPASSPADAEAVSAVARSLRRTRVAALARALPGDIDAAAEALRHAKAGRIHIFISTSAIHIRKKLRMTEEQVLEATTAAVRRARARCDDVQWSAEDCTRTDYAFMCRVFETAIKAGASTVTIADTVGFANPDEMRRRIQHLRERVPGMRRVTLAVHCHDDLGLGVANSLAAAAAGAGELQCTINGIGERAGNASLEEIVMAIRTRPDAYPYRVRVDTHELLRTSQLVSQITGFLVPPNKAIVGANAFVHESGIHQDGVLKSAITYEIMRPESVGAVGRDIVLGRHSGRHGLKNKLAAMGIQVSDQELALVLQRLKALFGTKKHVSDEEVYAVVTQSGLEAATSNGLTLERLEYSKQPGGCAVTLGLRHGGKVRTLTRRGTRVVEEILTALTEASPVPVTLITYSARNLGSGTDASAHVTVQLESRGRSAHGVCTDVDLIQASATAFLQALNHLLERRKRWTWRTGPPPRASRARVRPAVEPIGAT